MWSAFFSRLAGDFLDITYPGNCIDCRIYSMTRTFTKSYSFRFLLVGSFIVYSILVYNVEQVRQRVQDNYQLNQNIPGIFERVRNSMIRPTQQYIATYGNYFESLKNLIVIYHLVKVYNGLKSNFSHFRPYKNFFLIKLGPLLLQLVCFNLTVCLRIVFKRVGWCCTPCK